MKAQVSCTSLNIPIASPKPVCKHRFTLSPVLAGSEHSAAEDQIPAVHYSHSSFDMQHNEQREEDISRSYPTQLMTPSQQHPPTSPCAKCCCTLPEEATAPSPASVRPKQRQSASTHQTAANTTNEDSHCSQCTDCPDADGCSDAATTRQEQPHPRKATKVSSKASGSKRRVRVKKQAKKAPLVMSKCYAAAVHPFLEQPDDPEGFDAPGR